MGRGGGEIHWIITEVHDEFVEAESGDGQARIFWYDQIERVVH